MEVNELLSRAKNWDKQALAKLISLVENGVELPISFERRSHIIGITGPPGSGKSTLIYSLVRRLPQDSRIAVITLDPSSPFTGGSFMGNRIRMQELTVRPNVYIRSMATRGNRGGLNYAAVAALDLFEYAGADYVIIETVGAGQTDTDVKYVADTILVLVPPMSGDEIQALKSGIMEIGDIYLVSKADTQASESVYNDLIAMVDIMKEIRGNDWRPTVLKVSGLYGYGVDELIKILNNRYVELSNKGKLNETLKARRLLEMKLYTYELLNNVLERNKDLEEKVANGEITPVKAALKILDNATPRLDHVAIAVKDLDAAAGKFRRLGFEVTGPIVVESQGVKVMMVHLGNTKIELLEPLSQESTIAKFIESRGEGIHHIAIEVDDINKFIKVIQDAGMVLTSKPTKGAEGVVAFVHPKSLNGVLLELVQRHEL